MMLEHIKLIKSESFQYLHLNQISLNQNSKINYSSEMLNF